MYARSVLALVLAALNLITPEKVARAAAGTSGTVVSCGRLLPVVPAIDNPTTGYDLSAAKKKAKKTAKKAKKGKKKKAELVTDLSRRAQVLRVEIGGASLEDVFVQLMGQQKEEAS